MRNFRIMATIATLATYFLIFMGGLVRVSGAGLGCPDWPKCFGRWIPPLSLSQLPADIDPNLFNLTLAWIEYINRLFGVSVGILIAIVAIWALIKFRKIPRIVIPSALAGLLVAFQGWHGSRVVASELEPLVVSVHMALALIIVSLLIYISQQAYYIERPDAESKSIFPRRMKRWVGLLWVLALIQVVIGTRFREAIEIISRNFPLLSEQALIGQAGAIKYFHPVAGIIIAIASLAVAYRLLFQSRNPSSLNWQCAWTMAGLAIIQLLIGAGMLWIGIPAVAQVLHLWVASLMIGIILISFTALGQKQEA